MNFLLNRMRFCMLVFALSFGASAAMAASIEAASHKGFGRINFAFGAPAKLNASVSGSTATLTFSAPVTESPEAIRAALPAYVRDAKVSADKRTVTLTLNKPYRIRQFVGSNGIGVDLVGEPGETTAEAAPQKPTSKPEDLSSDASETPKAAVTSKLVPVAGSDKPAAKPAPKAVEKPVAKVAEKPKPVVVAKKPEEKKPAPVKTAAAAPITPVEVAPAAGTEKPTPAADPILSTKPVEQPAAEKPAAAKETPKAPEPVLSTKPTETAAKEPAAPVTTTKEAPKETPKETAKPVEKPAPEHPELTTKTAEAAKPAPEAVTTKEPAKEPAKPAEPAPVTAPKEAPKPAAVKGKPVPFVVGARTVNGETVINFPWQERTAAAVFKRARDIWVVFSHQKDVNVALLRSVMPKQVVNVTQYAYKGNTVLRIVTDGSILARANQAEGGGYGWNITLGTTPSKPTQDIGVAADSLQGTMRIVMAVFDVSEPLKFYDPTVGDQLIIVPGYENSRGVTTERNFPEFGLFPTAQGVAILNKSGALNVSQTRSGLILSSKDGLAVSDTLPMVAGTSPTTGQNSGVMIPYSQWYVPTEKFHDTLMERLADLSTATKANRADALMEVLKMYMAQGECTDALGILGVINSQFPQYYSTNKLAMLSGACHVLMGHFPDAARDLAAPELMDMEEAALWREVLSLNNPGLTTVQQIQQAVTPPDAPSKTNDTAANPPVGTATAAPVAPLDPNAAPANTAPKAVFHFLKFNKPFIRYYPPRIRQRLAIIAADAYMEDGQEEKALAVYDTLVRDGILEQVKDDAEFTLGRVAEKKGQMDQAAEVYDRLSKQAGNRYIQMRARYANAMMKLRTGKMSGQDAADEIESVRTSWHGDKLEHQMLVSLVAIYKDLKRYDEVLRSLKAIIEGFPEDPETLRTSTQLSQLFEDLYLGGMANDMEPLKALSLFYEFRELTPLGEKGDTIIQKLADRLASLDLLDRATQLLEHQIKFRTTAEARSQVGARLALLHLLNHHPQEALSVLEVTNYGGNSPELQIQRQQLTAEALMKLGKNEEALGVIFNDTTKPGALLRLDILWAMQDWPNVANHAEDILSERANLTDPLTGPETEVLLKLALAYTFESDYTQLRYLRDYYTGLIPDTNYKQIFDYITNDTTPLDPEDFALLAQQISRTESFMDTFKAKIAAGKLSDAVK